MTFDLHGLLDLWSRPARPLDEATADFARFYTDPVTVNGVPMPLSALAERAAVLAGTLADLTREVLDVAETGDKVAVAFRLSGRHVGTMSSSAGPVPATGRHLSIRVIDILTLTDGRISSLWMTADELGALSAAGAVRPTA